MAGLKYADLLLAVIAIYTNVYWEIDQDSPRQKIDAELVNISAASEALRGAEASSDLKVKEVRRVITRSCLRLTLRADRTEGTTHARCIG